MRIASNFSLSRLSRKTSSRAKLRNSANTTSKTASSRISTSKTKARTTTGTANALKTTEIRKNYTAIKNAASGIQAHASKLMATGNDSLFGAVSSKKTSDSSQSTEAELTQVKDKVLKEIDSFVEDYNTMVDKMSTIGGTFNNLYLKQMKGYATENQSTFKKIGITQNSDGTLSVNQKSMKAADVNDIKNLCCGKDSFAAKVSAKSKIVESNASAAIATLNKSYTSSYDKYGYLSGNTSGSTSWFNTEG